MSPTIHSNTQTLIFPQCEDVWLARSQADMSMQPDLKLVLGGGEGVQSEIMVFHQIMMNASPVFGAMLKPDTYLEGLSLTRDKHPELSLPDDNVEAMTVICNILHLQPLKVPTTTITPDLLYNIATIVDKYDFVRAIHPWPMIWYNQKHIQTGLQNLDPCQIETLPKWVHICCHLGFYDDFKKLTSALITRLSPGDLIEGPFNDNFARLTLIVQEEIRLQRQRCADKFRHFSLNLIADLEEGKSCTMKSLAEARKMSRFHCSSILLGNAILALREAFGPAWRLEKAWADSLTNLYQKMEKIGRRLTGPLQFAEGPYADRTHHGCSMSTGFMDPLKPIYDRATAGLELEEVGNSFYRELRNDQ